MTNEEQITEKCRKFLFDGQPENYGVHGNLDKFVEIMNLVWAGMKIWSSVDKQATVLDLDVERRQELGSEIQAVSNEMGELYKNHSREVISAAELILNGH
jgi:hypothetical protein